MRWKRGITLGFVFSISMVKVNVKDNDTNRDPRWVNETTTIKTLKGKVRAQPWVLVQVLPSLLTLQPFAISFNLNNKNAHSNLHCIANKALPFPSAIDAHI